MKNILVTIALVIMTFTNAHLVFAGSDNYAKQIEKKDSTLHFDQAQPQINHINFAQKDPLAPKPNGFRLIEAAFMSNNLGERWAMVTIENTTSGRRFYKNENIVATFANGSQSKAIGLDKWVEGGASLTKAIYFGASDFPIIKVTVE